MLVPALTEVAAVWMDACLLSHPHPKREVHIVDHLNNALNNSTVPAVKKEATTGSELDQQSARHNSKFSICAAENSLHLHDKQDICAGAWGPDEAAGAHELGGLLSQCHQPAQNTTALSTAQLTKVRAKSVGAAWAALEEETRDLICVSAKRYENRRKREATRRSSDWHGFNKTQEHGAYFGFADL